MEYINSQLIASEEKDTFIVSYIFINKHHYASDKVFQIYFSKNLLHNSFSLNSRIFWQFLGISGIPKLVLNSQVPGVIDPCRIFTTP